VTGRRVERIVPYEAGGGWKAKVIAANNRVVYRSEEPFESRGYAVAKALQAYPNATVDEPKESA